MVQFNRKAFLSSDLASMSAADQQLVGFIMSVAWKLRDAVRGMRHNSGRMTRYANDFAQSMDTDFPSDCNWMQSAMDDLKRHRANYESAKTQLDLFLEQAVARGLVEKPEDGFSYTELCSED